MARFQADVLVVISHYNAWPTDQLFSLLDQILNVRAGCPFGVRIVVNQARPVRLNLPGRHTGIEVIHRENTGFNIGAWEAGWRVEPRREIYLFLQEECRIVRPGWLQAFVALARNPRVGLVGELSNEHWDARWSFLTYHSRYYRREAQNSADAKAFDAVSYNLDYLERNGIPRGPREIIFSRWSSALGGLSWRRSEALRLAGLTKKRWPPRLPCPRKSRPLVWRSSK